MQIMMMMRLFFLLLGFLFGVHIDVRFIKTGIRVGGRFSDGVF
jgi:hypothetical protein